MLSEGLCGLITVSALTALYTYSKHVIEKSIAHSGFDCRGMPTLLSQHPSEKTVWDKCVTEKQRHNTPNKKKKLLNTLNGNAESQKQDVNGEPVKDIHPGKVIKITAYGKDGT